MPRPHKDNAEYFSHDSDSSGNWKIIYLESKFGLTGYAVFFKMLEILASSTNFEVELNEVSSAIFAKKIGVSMQEFSAIIKECLKPEISAFCLRDGILYSPGLKKRLKYLVDKRIRNRNFAKRNAGVPGFPEEIPEAENTSMEVIDVDNEVSDVDNPIVDDNQTSKTHKVKESRVKESKKKKKDDLHDDDDAVPIFSINNNSSKKDISKLFSIWSRAPGSQAEISITEELLKSFSFSEVEEAFYRSAEYNAYNLPYVKAILNNSEKQRKENKNETTDTKQCRSKQPRKQQSAHTSGKAGKDFSSVIITSARSS